MIGPGATIRDIRLVERLGSGGMGEVFVGVQDTLDREVAVKAIRVDRRLDGAARRRFLREARILSQLEHPNICRLYDLIEVDGQDFIVLELIRGRSLRELVGESPSEAEKLDIAEQVVAALAAAHAISVVHRDLKPENIMVADDGTVKVLDFGLARRTAETEHPPSPVSEPPSEDVPPNAAVAEAGWTRLGDVLGTPRYMSPEQARGEALTAASDMYAFGLLLQELWTGRPPYGVGLTAEEMVQKAMWGDIAPAEGIDLQVTGLIGSLTVFEPGQRPTAAAAADRLRWIKELPWRRARKRATTAAVAALVLAAVTSTAGFFIARQAQRRAEAARTEAEAVNQFLRGMLASAAPDRQGIDTKVVDVLGGAAATVDSDFANHPLSRASVHFTLGETYLSLGVWPAARDQLESAAEIRRIELGPDHRATLKAQTLVGVALSNDGRWADAEASLRNTLERCRRALGDDDADTVAAGANLAVVLQRLNRYDEAEPMVRQEVGWKRRALGEEDGGTLDARLSLANLLARSGRSNEAEIAFRDILAIRQRVFGDDHPDTISTASNLAVLLGRNEARAAEAEAMFAETVERRQRVFGPDHPETLRTVDMQAVLLRRMGRYEEAEALSREVLERRLATLGQQHPDVLESKMTLAVVLTKQGRNDAAEALLRQTLEVSERTLGPDHRITLNTLGNLGNLLIVTGRYEEAEPVQRRILAGFRRTLGDGHPAVLSAQNNLARVLLGQDKVGEAAVLVTETLARQRDLLGPEHPRTLNTLGNQGVVFRRQGRTAEAEAAFGELLNASERIFGPDHPRTRQARQDLATLLRETGRPSDAAALEADEPRPR